MLLALIGGLTYPTRQGGDVFVGLFMAQIVAITLLTILLIAWGMMLSNPAIAASQFAIIMAIPNFGRSTMSGASGQIVENFGYGTTYFVAAGLTAIALLLFLYAASGREQPEKNP